jgi:hypothetical protein
VAGVIKRLSPKPDAYIINSFIFIHHSALAFHTPEL